MHWYVHANSGEWGKYDARKRWGHIGQWFIQSGVEKRTFFRVISAEITYHMNALKWTNLMAFLK